MFVLKKEIYYSETKGYVCQGRLMLDSSLHMDMDYYSDLCIATKKNGICVISWYDTNSSNIIRYSFMDGSKVIDRIKIDFSQEIDHDECIKKYIPEFERIVDMVKAQIERDQIKKMLDGLEK